MIDLSNVFWLGVSFPELAGRWCTTPRIISPDSVCSIRHRQSVWLMVWFIDCFLFLSNGKIYGRFGTITCHHSCCVGFYLSRWFVSRSSIRLDRLAVFFGFSLFDTIWPYSCQFCKIWPLVSLFCTDGHHRSIMHDCLALACFLSGLCSAPAGICISIWFSIRISTPVASIHNRVHNISWFRIILVNSAR